MPLKLFSGSTNQNSWKFFESLKSSVSLPAKVKPIDEPVPVEGEVGEAGGRGQVRSTGQVVTAHIQINQLRAILKRLLSIGGKVGEIGKNAFLFCSFILTPPFSHWFPPNSPKFILLTWISLLFQLSST